MELLLKELEVIIQSEIIKKQQGEEQQPTRIYTSSSLVREETLQNKQIAESRENNESIDQQIQNSRLEFLRKLEVVYSKEQPDGDKQLSKYLMNFKTNFGYTSQDRLYPWQLLQSLESIRQFDKSLVLLSDKNPILNGGLVYSLLKDLFKLFYDIDLISIFEQQKVNKNQDKTSQIQLDEQHIENIWNNVFNSSNIKNTIFFLNLEHLTPAKMIFIAKLQKHFQYQEEKKIIPSVVIYSDDILSVQLKEICKPKVEITLDLYRMPQKIMYQQQQLSQQCSKQKLNKIEQIIIDSLKKYKKNLLRFDFLIFVQNIEEAQYLQEHHLNLIKEKLNIIDLTGQDIEDEEVPFFEDEFKKQWFEADELRKQKEKEEKERQKQEQLKKQQEQLKLQQEEEEKNKQKQQEILNIEKENIQIENELQNVEPNNVQAVELPLIVEQQINEPLQVIDVYVPDVIPDIDIDYIPPHEGLFEEPEIQMPGVPQNLQDILQLEIEQQQNLIKEQVEVPQESEEEKQKKEEERKKREEEEKQRLEDEEKKQQLIRFNTDLQKHLTKNKQNLYDKKLFNVFLAKSHKQLRYHQLNNILIQIDTGEAYKVYFMDTIFESVPVVSSKITREEALKRERLMGQTFSCEIHRLYSRNEFLRLQKRDFLNLINLEKFKFYSEISQVKCKENQAIRILLHALINLNDNWFRCSSEVSAHVSILWSRMGDPFSLHYSLLQIPQDSDSYKSESNPKLKNTLEKNQINSLQFDQIVSNIINISNDLNLQMCPIKTLLSIEPLKFSELIQQIIIEKFYKNLCVYSGHRRHGFSHIQSGTKINYADISSMNLIQERPFLIIPIQLQINSKNQYEIKQCIAIDHPFLLENAPSQFIDKHQLRLLKRQSLNLHEIEYFGISDALFQYFEVNQQIIKEMETKYDCYYEPNHHMDTITIHCDASQKDKLEKYFNHKMEEAQKELSEEIIELSNGNNSILKIQKGGLIKEVIILQNDHVFIVDNLPLTAKEQDLIDLFSEYGEILNVKFFTDINQQQSSEKSVSAEVLVSDTEDSSFFVETFNQILFQGRIIQLRQKNHSYKIHLENNSTKYYSIFKWQTWKSKQTVNNISFYKFSKQQMQSFILKYPQLNIYLFHQGKIEFSDESSVLAFMKLIQNKLVVDSKEIKAEIDQLQSKVVILKELHKNTDETTLKQCLSEELKNNVVKIKVDRIQDVDRGISKASLIHILNRLYQDNHQIKWVKRSENGFIEAKLCFEKNFLHKMNNYYSSFNSKADLIGQQKLYVEKNYIQTFNFEYKLMNIVQMILKGNKQLVKMQQENQICLKEKIIRPVPSKQDLLIVLKSKEEGFFNKAKAILNALITPKQIELRNIKSDQLSPTGEEQIVDHSQMFTEIGQKKLKELEKKYPIQFKIDLVKEEIKVFCTESIYALINKEIEYFLKQSIRIKIPISGKNIRNILGIDGKGLEEFKNKAQLTKIQLDYISKDVYMEGSSKNVDQAKNALLALLEEKNSSSCHNNMPYSYEDCQVCSNTISTGYRLQGCGHKFCLSCIMFIIDNSLGDVSSLPIKCPFCSKAMIIKDIQTLMNEEQIQKMTRMALNHYVQNNFQEINFCVNENCKSIHSSKLEKYTCYECQKTYCAKCSAEYHYGMTCTVYQETDAKNIEFLIKEGARKCPNCSVFIIRIDGCYRVECRRCAKHICWKDNCMKFYDTSTECYNHLDEKHGGYW